MNVEVLTLFPDLVENFLKWGVIKQSPLKVRTLNPRIHSQDAHGHVDDRPFGGGDGMILKGDILARSLEALRGGRSGVDHVVYLSAQGQPWTDQRARQYAQMDKTLVLVCGRYGGIDQRFINEFVDEEISIGDYVLSGGELPALVMLESISRFLPGTLGNEESLKDSFADGLLEGPSFTRPPRLFDQEVPEVLLGGHHQKVADLRWALSVAYTQKNRPELLQGLTQEARGRAREILKGLSRQDLVSAGLEETIL